MPNKKAGRRYADELALYALTIQANSIKIKQVVYNKQCKRVQEFLDECIYQFEYNAVLTYHEMVILCRRK